MDWHDFLFGFVSGGFSVAVIVIVVLIWLGARKKSGG